MYLRLIAELGNVGVNPDNTDFEGMKGHRKVLRLGTEMLGETIGEGADTLEVEGPGLRSYEKKLRSGTTNGVYAWLLKVQPSCRRSLKCLGEASTMDDQHQQSQSEPRLL